MDFLKDIEIDEEVKGKLAEQFESYLNETTSGLKSKVDELLGEKKRAQKAKEEAEAQARLKAEEKAKAENDYKQLFESQKTEADTLRQQIEKMNADIRGQKINAEAAKLAAGLTKDVQKAQLLQQQISQRLTLVDNEIRVADESGQLTVSTLDDLANSIKTAYPFLIDGSQATGGSATRSQGSAERAKQISRSEFDAMNSTQRADFFKSGGKLVDD